MSGPATGAPTSGGSVISSGCLFLTLLAAYGVAVPPQLLTGAVAAVLKS